MFNISQFLKKFKGIGVEELTAKDALVSALKKCIGVEVERKNVEYRNSTLYVKADPIVKNQIYIKKEQILESLGEELGNKIKDIR